MPEIPRQLVVIFPFVVTFLSGWLSEDKLPDWANALIGGAVVVASAVAWAMISQSLVSDLTVDIVLLIALCQALLNGPLAPLHRWLVVKIPSPYAALLPPATTKPSVAQPQPITLPDNQPPRD